MVFIRQLFMILLSFHVVSTSTFDYPLPEFTVYKTPLEKHVDVLTTLEYRIRVDNVYWTMKKYLYIEMNSSTTNNRPDTHIATIAVPNDDASTSETIETSLDSRLDFWAFGDGIKTSSKSKINIHCTDNSTENFAYYIARWKMADNPALNDGVTPAHVWLTIYVGDEFIFIYEEDITKNSVTGDEGETELGINFAEPDNMNYVHFPGTTATIVLRIWNKGEQSLSGLRIVINVPEMVDLALHSKDNMISGSLMTDFFTMFEVDVDQRTITIMMPYIDSITNVRDIYITYTLSNKDFMYSFRQNLTYIAIVDFSFCPFDSCDNTYQMKYLRQEVIHTVRPTFFPVPDLPVRLKYISSGRCWSVDKLNLAVSSKCRTVFVWNALRKLRLIETDLYLRRISNNYVFASSEGDLSDVLYQQKLLLVMYNHEKGAILEEISNDVDHTPSINLRTQMSAPDSEIKIMSAWDNMDDINLKSFLRGTTAVGDTIIICNPSGDLGNKFNCFFTKDTGATWTGISSVVTNINYYEVSSQLLYGKCLRGKFYCKMKILVDNSVTITYVSQNNWDTVRNNEVFESHVFDDDELPTEATAISVDASIGVSSKGLYIKDGQTWKMKFRWA